MDGVRAILRDAALRPGDIAIVIHGTTLATNAIIERKGARTALVTTAGFRDVLALRNESRYDQYDLNLVLPEPLVPRHLRLPVPERLDNEGRVLLPLDEAGGACAGAGAAARRRGEPRHRFSARLRQSRARTPRPRHSRRGPARAAGHAGLRGVAGDARVGTVLHRRRQRLCAAADGALSDAAGAGAARGRRRRAAVLDAVGRRPVDGGDRVPLPDPAGGERAGGRGDLFRARRAGVPA